MRSCASSSVARRLLFGFRCIAIPTSRRASYVANVNLHTNVAVCRLPARHLLQAIAAEVLEAIDGGLFDCRPLIFGVPISDRVEKQRAHFFSLRVTEADSQQGVAVKVESNQQSKFKLLHLRESGPSHGHADDGEVRSYNNKCYSISMQEDSSKMGKVTSAGCYFFSFPTYRIHESVNPLNLGADPEAALFRKLGQFSPSPCRQRTTCHAY